MAEAIALKFKITQKDAVAYVEAVLGLVKDTLESGEPVKIGGFGKFQVKQKADRQWRNPQTGETLTIAARKVITFSPSPLLKDRINGE